jgi:hypothetical protein
MPTASIFVVTVVDDRSRQTDGPVEEVRYFGRRVSAVRWLAQWVRDDLASLDEPHPEEDRLLALPDEQLIAEYERWQGDDVRLDLLKAKVHP